MFSICFYVTFLFTFLTYFAGSSLCHIFRIFMFYSSFDITIYMNLLMFFLFFQILYKTCITLTFFIVFIYGPTYFIIHNFCIICFFFDRMCKPTLMLVFAYTLNIVFANLDFVFMFFLLMDHDITL